MKKLLLRICACCLLLSGTLSAQSTFSFLSRSNSGVQSVVVDGVPVVDSVWLVNNGPDTTVYTGSLNIATGILDSTGHLASTIGYDSVTTTSINPGASQLFLLNLTFNTLHTNPAGRCRIGNNVVVIWPISNSPHFKCKDTLKLTVYVLPQSNKMDVYDLLNIFPNPTSGFLTIAHNGSYEMGIEQTEVYDLTGRLLSRFGNQRVIDVSDLSRGVYLVRVLFANGVFGEAKIWKE
jgi:hypothetical protein